jgi:hypothetical protein
VLGPWTADGELPEHRRVPESATVTAWRHQLANGNGSAPPDVRKIIASIKRLRASLPAEGWVSESAQRTLGGRAR